jgi:hypothetical protein
LPTPGKITIDQLAGPVGGADHAAGLAVAIRLFWPTTFWGAGLPASKPDLEGFTELLNLLNPSTGRVT